MKKNNLILLYIISCIFFTSGCEDEKTVDSELYKKEVYIVNAYNTIYNPEIKYSDKPQDSYTSVAVGGSIPTERDIVVTLSLDNQTAIDGYNWKNVAIGKPRYIPLNPSLYELTNTVTLKAGNVYEKVPIRIKSTVGLHCDSLYTIPISIKSVSTYAINKKDSILLFTPKFTNNYSGNYMLNGFLSKDGGTAEGYQIARILTAVDEYTVRMYQDSKEELAFAKENALTFKINPDDNTVTVAAWDKLNFMDGGGIYDPATKVFDIWYVFKNSEGKERRVEGKLIK